MSPTSLLPLAEVETIFPFLTACIFCLIPIVAIFTRHQQRMATILHGTDRSRLPADTEQRILTELMALRQQVNQQALIIDDLANANRALAMSVESADPVRERLTRG